MLSDVSNRARQVRSIQTNIKNKVKATRTKKKSKFYDYDGKCSLKVVPPQPTATTFAKIVFVNILKSCSAGLVVLNVFQHCHHCHKFQIHPHQLYNIKSIFFRCGGDLALWVSYSIHWECGEQADAAGRTQAKRFNRLSSHSCWRSLLIIMWASKASGRLVLDTSVAEFRNNRHLVTRVPRSQFYFNIQGKLT